MTTYKRPNYLSIFSQKGVWIWHVSTFLMKMIIEKCKSNPPKEYNDDNNNNPMV
jgi:hypothetical protein